MFSRPRKTGTAVYYSLAEYAYVILFIAIGVSAYLFTEYQSLREDNAKLQTRIDEMTVEIEELKRQLAESKQREAQLPCDAIIGSGVSATIGTVTIESATSYQIYSVRTDSTKRAENISESLAIALLANDVEQLFAKSIEYAAENECFVRARLVNETNDFALFERYRTVLLNAGIAVVLL